MFSVVQEWIASKFRPAKEYSESRFLETTDFLMTFFN